MLQNIAFKSINVNIDGALLPIINLHVTRLAVSALKGYSDLADVVGVSFIDVKSNAFLLSVFDVVFT